MSLHGEGDKTSSQYIDTFSHFVQYHKPILTCDAYDNLAINKSESDEYKTVTGINFIRYVSIRKPFYRNQIEDRGPRDPMGKKNLDILRVLFILLLQQHCL